MRVPRKFDRDIQEIGIDISRERHGDLPYLVQRGGEDRVWSLT